MGIKEELLKKGLKKGREFVAKQISPEVLNLGAKIGTDFIEKQKNLIKIPDLKDVHIDEALRVLEEQNLIPTSAIANPSIAYADENENEVMYSEPRFGSKVDPKTTVKLYYLTQEVIDKSRKLLGNVVKEFKVPNVIGLNVYVAREDLEGLGLKVTEKLEKPSLAFIGKEDWQVTRLAYHDNHKIGTKLKTGERVLLYYVSEKVILDSISMKEIQDRDKKGRIEKIGKVAKSLKLPFKKKKISSDKSEE